MDEDEIRVFAEGRPAVPPYRAEARAQARERLLAEARRGGRFRLPRFGWHAAAAFAVTIALVGGVGMTLSRQGGGTTSPVQSAVLSDQLDPRPGQYILIESDTMYPSYAYGKNGEESRHLYRTHRKIWQSVDGGKDGLLMIKGLDPKPWPGRELPPSDVTGERETGWTALPSCPGRQDGRTDYAYMSTLPADAAAMREHLYKRSTESEGKDISADMAAFTYVGDLVRETYLPKAQRDALFEAAKAIPGVEVAEGVEDSAGRKGVALGRRDPQGTLTQIIFDPATHMFLGERQTVVEDKGVGAPAGSVLALTAQLNVSVVDELPEAPTEGREAASCGPAPLPDNEPPSVGSTETPEPPPTSEATIEATLAPSGAPAPEEPAPTRTVTVTPRPEEPLRSEEPTAAPPRPGK
ncbi:CU044_5270 family protein [Nonomuraea sp. SYSU D8015]|uniref:CU044_5270 family protein n=1 Tax=Nonomuraea sp. SYSU D8015 TaxID=2593644 RepID=UPI0016605D7D|nr:CU044_5270 family protein [Nonomuraea sp. SYSU D8015]